MPETEELPRLLSIGQLAERLGTTPRHVRRLIAERRVPFVKVGRLVRFDPDDIAAWLDGRRVSGSQAIDGAAPPARLQPVAAACFLPGIEIDTAIRWTKLVKCGWIDYWRCGRHRSAERHRSGLSCVR